MSQRYQLWGFWNVCDFIHWPETSLNVGWKQLTKNRRWIYQCFWHRCEQSICFLSVSYPPLHLFPHIRPCNQLSCISSPTSYSTSEKPHEHTPQFSFGFWSHLILFHIPPHVKRKQDEKERNCELLDWRFFQGDPHKLIRGCIVQLN